MSTKRALQPRRRRQRQQLACNACRIRKTGCDGRRPVCGSCSMRSLGDQCDYQEKPASSPTPTLSSLHSRLQGLEGKFSGSMPMLGNVDNDTHVPPSASSSFIAQTSITHVARHEVAQGPLSDISFLEQVLQSKRDLDGTEIKDKVISEPPGLNTTQSPSWAFSMNPILLPNRELADTLLQCFSDSIHPIFPILHWPSFSARYDGLWISDLSSAHRFKQIRDDAVYLSILNMVLALGCQRSEQISAPDRKQVADSFYRRSYHLVSVETLDYSSLQVVQLLLLRGIYLHYTPYADRCWNMIGAALRVACGLGLHLEQEVSHENQLEREMRRRIWYNCITLDRLSATTFGRPVLHDRLHIIPMPEPIDDEFLSDVDKGCQPSHSPSRLAFFTYTIKLFDILGDVMGKLYSHECRNPTQDATQMSSKYLSELPGVCSKLDDYVKELPEHLRGSTYHGPARDGVDQCFHMQARVLNSRLLYIRLLTLRPSLLIEARRRVTNQHPTKIISTLTPLLSPSLREINLLCVSAAHEIIAEIHQGLSSLQETSPWHALFFTFGAASALLAASLCPELDVKLSAGRSKASWEKALEVFDFHKSRVESSGKGLEALVRFHKRFSATAKIDEAPNSTDCQVASPINFGDDLVDETWQAELAGDFDDFFRSDSLEQSWLSSQVVDWAFK